MNILKGLFMGISSNSIRTDAISMMMVQDVGAAACWEHGNTSINEPIWTFPGTVPLPFAD